MDQVNITLCPLTVVERKIIAFELLDVIFIGTEQKGRPKALFSHTTTPTWMCVGCTCYSNLENISFSPMIYCETL